jgi:hypothetical protein
MAMWIRPEKILAPKGLKFNNSYTVNSNLILDTEYAIRYRNQAPQISGAIPSEIRTNWNREIPDSIFFGETWFLSNSLLDFFQKENGLHWPIEAQLVQFVRKNNPLFEMYILTKIPRFHRFDHLDPNTYNNHITDLKQTDGPRWLRYLNGDLSPNGRAMIPFENGNPHFWEDPGVLEGDTYWSGDGMNQDKYVSDALWELLTAKFPKAFSSRYINERSRHDRRSST